jgi:hypothetical protein
MTAARNAARKTARKTARAYLPAAIILAFGLLACGLLSPNQPVQSPTQMPVTPTGLIEHSPTRTPVPDNAQTPDPSPTPARHLEPTAAVSESPAGRLPMAVYYLATDAALVEQVWRFDPDGVSATQVTFTPGGVSAFDVTAAGSRLAYITGNQLVIQELSTGSTRIVVDGEPDDGSEGWSYSRRIDTPCWSPDGSTLAYGHNGLNLYGLTAGGIRPVLANRVVDRSGFPFPEILFRPDRWSPDGTAILVDVGFYEGADKAIYNLEEDRNIEFSRADQTTICCSSAWAADSSYVLLAGYSYGGSSSELWRMDAFTGDGSVLVPSDAGDSTFDFVDWPHALDGRLQYFYANIPAAPPTTPPLVMVQSGLDGVTGRTLLRPETMFLLDALWAEDGSLAVGVQSPPGGPTWPAHGPLVAIYTDGRPIWPLAPDGRQPRWGP